MSADVKPVNLQNRFLDKLCQGTGPATIRLMSGSDVTGKIAAYDNYVIVLRQGAQEQMIFKHAIAAILPATT
jgi:host factor-I protein